VACDEVRGDPSAPLRRYLYVNSRAWPRDCVISDPMQPPPIAEEIDLHVFDLKTMKEVKRALRAHRAYTPNEECFFIFLDVSRDFVARCVVRGGGQGPGRGAVLRGALRTQGRSLRRGLPCTASRAGSGGVVKSRGAESGGAVRAGCPGRAVKWGRKGETVARLAAGGKWPCLGAVGWRGDSNSPEGACVGGRWGRERQGVRAARGTSSPAPCPPQRGRGSPRLHLGPALQHLPGQTAARQRGELSGFQPRGAGAAPDGQRRQHHQGVAVPARRARPAARRAPAQEAALLLAPEPAQLNPARPAPAASSLRPPPPEPCATETSSGQAHRVRHVGRDPGSGNRFLLRASASKSRGRSGQQPELVTAGWASHSFSRTLLLGHSSLRGSFGLREQTEARLRRWDGVGRGRGRLRRELLAAERWADAVVQGCAAVPRDSFNAGVLLMVVCPKPSRATCPAAGSAECLLPRSVLAPEGSEGGRAGGPGWRFGQPPGSQPGPRRYFLLATRCRHHRVPARRGCCSPGAGFAAGFLRGAALA